MKESRTVGDDVWSLNCEQAVDTAVRVLKEGGMDAIKLEGGAPSRITAAKAIVEAGIAVMGHVGLTPQAISVLGGFRPQGKNIASAVKVYIIYHISYIYMYIFCNCIIISSRFVYNRLWRRPWHCRKQGVSLWYWSVFLHQWLLQLRLHFKSPPLASALVPFAVVRFVEQKKI